MTRTFSISIQEDYDSEHLTVTAVIDPPLREDEPATAGAELTAILLAGIREYLKRGGVEVTEGVRINGEQPGG